jgi:hypothetical protein
LGTDPKTRALVAAAVPAADAVFNVNGKHWHEDAFSFAVLVSALDKVLKAMKPPGEPRPNPESLMPILYDPDVAPETVAAGIAASIISDWKNEGTKP